MLPIVLCIHIPCSLIRGAIASLNTSVLILLVSRAVVGTTTDIEYSTVAKDYGSEPEFPYFESWLCQILLFASNLISLSLIFFFNL